MHGQAQVEVDRKGCCDGFVDGAGPGANPDDNNDDAGHHGSSGAGLVAYSRVKDGEHPQS